MKKLRTLVAGTVLLLALCLGARDASAQYHFEEWGWRVGAGAAVPFGDNEMTPGFAANGQLFYSRYVCGKAYGYHLEGGVRLFSLYEYPTGGPGLEAPAQSGLFYYWLGGLTLGAYGKLRPKDYHRDKEVCMMVGPVVSWLPVVTGALGGIVSNEYRDVNRFQPGAGLSVWLRRPMGGDLSWHLALSGEYYPGRHIRTDEVSFSALQLGLNIGVTLWDSR